MSPGVPNPKSKSQSIERRFSWKVAADLSASFRYAWAGISYAFATQRNFRIHVVIGSVAVGLAVGLSLEAVKVAVIGLTIGLVLALELLNTALESIVDLTVKQTYHELAKIAKDCAAGAVLIGALASVFVAGFLIIPPLLAQLTLMFGH
ncbi:MAG: diacylglycerol kinase family protein [Cyanobacteria bacterium SID2]|nr:diacylglycerol kinase family protein [Cyanobacteria bacterium SID2]MBP0002403.1 diacylglycerol kinase family protein [Cyanobacteria bacterium SBC]